MNVRYQFYSLSLIMYVYLTREELLYTVFHIFGIFKQFYVFVGVMMFFVFDDHINNNIKSLENPKNVKHSV